MSSIRDYLKLVEMGPGPNQTADYTAKQKAVQGVQASPSAIPAPKELSTLVPQPVQGQKYWVNGNRYQFNNGQWNHEFGKLNPKTMGGITRSWVSTNAASNFTGADTASAPRVDTKSGQPTTYAQQAQQSGKRPAGSSASPTVPPTSTTPSAPAAGSIPKNVQDLATANNIKDANRISVGQQIKLPDGSTYTVAPGDTLSGIASGKYKGTAPGPELLNREEPAAEPAPAPAPAPATTTPAAEPAPAAPAVSPDNPFGPKVDPKVAAWEKLSPAQKKWMGGADPTDPIILSRMKSALPNEPDPTAAPVKESTGYDELQRIMSIVSYR